MIYDTRLSLGRWRCFAATLVLLAVFPSESRCRPVSNTPVPIPVAAAPVVFDGVLAAGYVDRGAFVNFLGPALKLSRRPWSLSLGMLPSLRIKKDRVAADQPHNAAVTPSLGAGLTFTYRHLALQAPLYYNAKTGSRDGKWVVGIGLGYKF